MIFLSAFTNNIIVEDYKRKRKEGQFYEEYKVLLKSIYKIYPEATPILFIYEGKVSIMDLRKIHPKLIVFNWQKHFNQELGIDLNYLRSLKEILSLMRDDIVMIDPDCLVVKRFDEYINDKVDITVVTRGTVNWRGHRQDLIFAPAIYHNNNRDNVLAYIDKIFVDAYKFGIKEDDWWANVQPTVTKLFIDSNINLEVDYNNFESQYGKIVIDDKTIKVKVVPQYVLSYPIQDEKYYEQTRIIHYKNYKDRSTPNVVYKNWMDRNQ